MPTYKMNVSSPWRLHLHWGAYWRWWPSHWQTAFQEEIWWLCFRLETHVIGGTYEP